MGKTAFQKITEAHLAETLADGSMVLRLDRVWAHEITTPNAIIDMVARGCDVVFNPNSVKAMIDHCNPAKDTASAVQGKMMREWSKKHDIEFLDVGRNGICHSIIPQSGWALPGEIGIMGDSHTGTHGVMCALAIGVGTTELETGIITGLIICPPQKVIRVNFVGKLPANVYSKDLILTLINKIGTGGATGAVLEFGGPVIEELSMDARMTITNMAIEAGATSGMMMVDQKTINYLRPAALVSRSIQDFGAWNSDPDAQYDQVVEIDVSGMVPVITANPPAPPLLPDPGQIVDVSELAGKKVDQVYIGSCTNGRIEDLRIAAGILSGHKVAANIRCIIVPGTQEIYDYALHEGLISIFIHAGCYVSGPTCGACLGMSTGVLAPGEVCVSTTNRNFLDRMGKGGIIHLASPATAALTAREGKIAEPSVELCQKANFAKGIVSTAVPTKWEEKSYQKPRYREIFANMGGGRQKDFSGQVFYLPYNNVNTDQIIPAKYLTETSKALMGAHCFEDMPLSSEERVKFRKSKIIVAGENFGSGSSREHAPWALEVVGIQCVIAKSFARIFETNMFANGLLCITLPKEDMDKLIRQKPEKISINIQEGVILWIKGMEKGVSHFKLPSYQKEQILNGGSVSLMLKLAANLQEAGKI